MLCLSGTPFQNRLADVQSLISLLKIWPWNQDWIWRQHLIPGMTVGNRHAVQTLNRMMQILCLQRTKQAILNLPRKIEKAIVVSMEERWERFSKDLHDEFIHLFGRLRMAGEPWNPAEFFQQLDGRSTRRPRWSCPASRLLAHDVGEDFDALLQDLPLLLLAQCGNELVRVPM